MSKARVRYSNAACGWVAQHRCGGDHQWGEWLDEWHNALRAADHHMRFDCGRREPSSGDVVTHYETVEMDGLTATLTSTQAAEFRRRFEGAYPGPNPGDVLFTTDNAAGYRYMSDEEYAQHRKDAAALAEWVERQASNPLYDYLTGSSGSYQPPGFDRPYVPVTVESGPDGPVVRWGGNVVPADHEGGVQEDPTPAPDEDPTVELGTIADPCWGLPIEGQGCQSGVRTGWWRGMRGAWGRGR